MRNKFTNTLITAVLVTILMLGLSLGHTLLKESQIGMTLNGEIFLPIINSEADASEQNDEVQNDEAPPAEEESDPPAEEVTQPPAEEQEQPVDPNENDNEKAIRLLAAQENMALHLAAYPGWAAVTYDEGNGVIYVEFRSAEGDEYEWLGDGRVNVQTDEVEYVFAPRELTTEEYQAGLAKVEAYLPYDAEIQGRLGNPDVWEKWVDWDRWEQQWTVGYTRGLEKFVVYFNLWDDKLSVDRYEDPNLLEAQEQAEWARSQAIELAFETEGIWQILEGVDDWKTYVEPQEGSVWSVAVVAGETELFNALVNTETWTVIEHSGN